MGDDISQLCGRVVVGFVWFCQRARRSDVPSHRRDPGSSAARRRAKPVTIATIEEPDMLDAGELHALDLWWRAANYLSRRPDLPDGRDPLLREQLTIEQVKPRLLGHWGTTPGLNFIYAHLNRVIRARELDMIYVCGPGHGGPGMVATTWLEGSYTEMMPRDPAQPGRDGNAVAAVQLPRRHPQPRRGERAGLDQRGRRARLFDAACRRRGVRQSRTDRDAAWSATARRRPGRWPRAGTATNS